MSTVGDSTRESNAFTICKETVSGVVSVWHAVIVCATKSTREGAGALPLGCEGVVLPTETWGEGGGETKAWAEDGASAKKEYDMSLDMQSRLAIISFSLLVSHARRNGSKTSRGRSPPWLFRTSSNARWVLSRKGAERFASLEAAMVSRADDIKTTDTLFPWAIVSERLCSEGPEGLGFRVLGVDGRELVLESFV